MKQTKVLLSLFIVFASSTMAHALTIPAYKGRVNDHAGLLKSEEMAALEQKIAAWEQQTSNQMGILLIRSLEGEILEEFSHKVAETWGIGQKGKDNGILILVAQIDRQMRIEVGYGLEGAIPDGVAGRIIREEMVPRFRESQFALGLALAIDKIALAAQGEYTAEGSGDGGDESFGLIVLYLIGVAFVLIIAGAISCWLSSILGGIAGSIFGMLLGTGILLISFLGLLGILLGLLIGKVVQEADIGSSGGWSSGWYSGGGWSGGGSSGRGFSFGGGGFGGGGASGSW